MKNSPSITPERRRVSKKFTQKSMTHQSFGNECNVNAIMARYEKSGLLTHTNNRQPSFGDFTEMPSYQDSLDLIIHSQNLFDELPALVRKRFHNNPVEFLEFAQNPENLPEMVKLGLATPKAAHEPEPSKLIPDIQKPKKQPIEAPIPPEA